jgi:tetratricopeptide (TPR) repeat protein
LADNSEKLWLVKSSGHIKGPFGFSEIKELLATKDISIHDEISRPFQRWAFLRDQSEFAKVVADLRVSSASGGDVTATNAEDHTMTMSVTEPLDPYLRDELTEEIDLHSTSRKSSSFEADSGVKSVRGPARKVSSQHQASYGMSSDRAIEQRAKESAKKYWMIMVGLVAVCVIGLLMVKSFNSSGGKDDYETLVEKGRASLAIREYDQALKYLKEAKDLRPAAKEFNQYLGVLLIQQEGQTVEGRRLLEQVLLDNPLYKKEAYLGIGLSYLMDREYSRALDAFAESMSLSPNTTANYANIGAVHLIQEDFEAAYRSFLKSFKTGDHQGITYVMMAQTQVFLWQKTGQKKYLTEALTSLDGFLKRDQSYIQEVLLVSAYIQYLLKNKLEVATIVDEILDADPFLAQDHGSNLFYYRGRANWQALLPWCQQLTQEMGSEVRYILLDALCLANANRITEARQRAQDGVDRAPKSPIAQSIFAYVLFRNGRTDKASIAVGRSAELDRSRDYRLPTYMQARFCERRKDWDCSESKWKTLLDKDVDSVSAIAGMLRATHERGQINLRNTYFLRLEKNAKNHKTYLKVKRELEKGR